jgi:hypothetical protein
MFSVCDKSRNDQLTDPFVSRKKLRAASAGIVLPAGDFGARAGTEGFAGEMDLANISTAVVEAFPWLVSRFVSRAVVRFEGDARFCFADLEAPFFFAIAHPP